MAESHLVTLEVPSMWDVVRDVQKTVAEALKSYPPEVREAAVMAASELVENAVKYGQRAAHQREASLVISATQTELVIRVSTGVRSRAAAQATIDRITAIRAAPDKFELYVDKIRELMAGGRQSGQLGLLRVAGEGGFDLNATLDDDVLHVTARRPLGPASGTSLASV